MLIFFPAIFGCRTCLYLYPASNQLLGVYSKIKKINLLILPDEKVVWGMNIYIFSFHCILFRYLKLKIGLLNLSSYLLLIVLSYFTDCGSNLQNIERNMLVKSLNLESTEWGWKVENGVIVPIPTIKSIALSVCWWLYAANASLHRKIGGRDIYSCYKNELWCMSTCSGWNCEDWNNTGAR